MAVPRSGWKMIRPRKAAVGMMAGSNVSRQSSMDLVRHSRKNAKNRKVYREQDSAVGISADVLNTITKPTNTRHRVTVNSQRSALTRFAMRTHSTTETRDHRDFLLLIYAES